MTEKSKITTPKSAKTNTIDQCIKCKFYQRINGKTFCTNQNQIRGDRRILHKTNEIPNWCDEWSDNAS